MTATILKLNIKVEEVSPEPLLYEQGWEDCINKKPMKEGGTLDYQDGYAECLQSDADFKESLKKI